MKSEQWFCFRDARGIGYAQTDIFMVFDTHVLLVECKLSQNTFAFPQMGNLYVPLLQHIYTRPVIGVQACKNLHFIPEKYWCEEIEDEFEFKGEKKMVTWHAFGV